MCVIAPAGKSTTMRMILGLDTPSSGSVLVNGKPYRELATFSLGMNQRLGIAAALLGDPETVLFDEPINGQDPDGIVWIRNLMKSLAAQGRTVFLSSQVMSEMAQTADHLLVIGRGRIIADASTAEFVNRNSVPAVQVRAVQLHRSLLGASQSAGTSMQANAQADTDTDSAP